MGRHGRSEDLCGTEVEIIMERLRVSYTVQAAALIASRGLRWDGA